MKSVRVFETKPCEYCGTAFGPKPQAPGHGGYRWARWEASRFCSPSCRGRQRTAKGYRRINGVPIHRAVMEEKLGRPLRRDEHVHHINHNIHDNRLENLVVLSRAEHARVHRHDEKVG